MDNAIYMTGKQEKKYRLFLWMLLFAGVAALLLTMYVSYLDKIPSKIKIRAGVELGLKKVSKDTAKTYFQLTDLKDKTAFLTMTAHKTYEPELAVMRRTQKTSVGLGL